MIKKFKEYLNSVNESYLDLEHMNIATNVVLKMLSGSLMALLHGIVPGVYFKLMLVIKLKNFMNSKIKKNKSIITTI